MNIEDSAGGTGEDARNPVNQAIYKLRGKILNSEDKHAVDLYKNSEVCNLLSALGCGVGTGFDIEKLRYWKVVIMSDADVDGKNPDNVCMCN